jgi:hypothetical protein
VKPRELPIRHLLPSRRTRPRTRIPHNPH